eukprot:g2131.t1
MPSMRFYSCLQRAPYTWKEHEQNQNKNYFVLEIEIVSDEAKRLWLSENHRYLFPSDINCCNLLNSLGRSIALRLNDTTADDQALVNMVQTALDSSVSNLLRWNTTKMTEHLHGISAIDIQLRDEADRNRRNVLMMRRNNHLKGMQRESEVNFRLKVKSIVRGNNGSPQNDCVHFAVPKDLFINPSLQGNHDPPLPRIDTQLYHDLLFLNHDHHEPRSKLGYLHEPNVEYGFDVINVYPTNTCIITPGEIELTATLGILLWGPPGTGKSTVSNFLLEVKDKGNLIGMCPIWFGTASELKRPYMGQTEKEIMARFECLKMVPHLLCCVAIDEIDTLTKKRTGSKSDSNSDWLSLMLRIVGSKDFPNLLLVGSTNLKGEIDEAMLRPGRLDKHIYFGRLDYSDRWKLFIKNIEACRPRLNVTYKDSNVSVDIFPDSFGRRTLNATGSEIKKVVALANTKQRQQDNEWEREINITFEQLMAEWDSLPRDRSRYDVLPSDPNEESEYPRIVASASTSISNSGADSGPNTHSPIRRSASFANFTGYHDDSWNDIKSTFNQSTQNKQDYNNLGMILWLSNAADTLDVTIEDKTKIEKEKREAQKDLMDYLARLVDLSKTEFDLKKWTTEERSKLENMKSKLSSIQDAATYFHSNQSSLEERIAAAMDAGKTFSKNRSEGTSSSETKGKSNGTTEGETTSDSTSNSFNLSVSTSVSASIPLLKIAEFKARVTAGYTRNSTHTDGKNKSTTSSTSHSNTSGSSTTHGVTNTTQGTDLSRLAEAQGKTNAYHFQNLDAEKNAIREFQLLSKEILNKSNATNETVKDMPFQKVHDAISHLMDAIQLTKAKLDRLNPDSSSKHKYHIYVDLRAQVFHKCEVHTLFFQRGEKHLKIETNEKIHSGNRGFSIAKKICDISDVLFLARVDAATLDVGSGDTGLKLKADIIKNIFEEAKACVDYGKNAVVLFDLDAIGCVNRGVTGEKFDLYGNPYPDNPALRVERPKVLRDFIGLINRFSSHGIHALAVTRHADMDSNVLSANVELTFPGTLRGIDMKHELTFYYVTHAIDILTSISTLNTSNPRIEYACKIIRIIIESFPTIHKKMQLLFRLLGIVRNNKDLTLNFLDLLQTIYGIMIKPIDSGLDMKAIEVVFACIEKFKKIQKIREMGYKTLYSILDLHLNRNATEDGKFFLAIIKKSSEKYWERSTLMEPMAKILALYFRKFPNENFSPTDRERLECWSTNQSDESPIFVELDQLKRKSHDQYQRFKDLAQEKGVDTNSLLLTIVKEDHPSRSHVQTTLKCCEDVAIKDDEGNTALHLAAKRGLNDIIGVLLKYNGIEIDIRNYDNENAIGLASDNNHQETVTLLQEKYGKAYKDFKALKQKYETKYQTFKDSTGRNWKFPEYLASGGDEYDEALRVKIDDFRVLWLQKKKMTGKDFEPGKSLSYASKNNRLEIVDTLLDYGLKPNNDILIGAVTKGHLEMAQKLLAVDWKGDKKAATKAALNVAKKRNKGKIENWLMNTYTYLSSEE